jgi:hypothetical protein
MTDYRKAYNDPSHPYHREALRVAEKWTDTTYVDGVVRWASNDQVPPQEILDLWAHLGFTFNMAKSQAARDADMEAFLAEYRANYTGPTDEERFEARAAHGPGVVLVNAITGQRWTT